MNSVIEKILIAEKKKFDSIFGGNEKVKNEDAWIVLISSTTCPYSARIGSVWGIKWFKKRCSNPEHPNASTWLYPKCEQDKCPLPRYK